MELSTGHAKKTSITVISLFLISAVDSRYFYWSCFPSEKQPGTHQSGTSGKTNQYCLSFRKHHKNTCHFTEHQFRSIEQTYRIVPSSKQLNLKIGCSGVNDKKRENRTNVLLNMMLKNSVLNKFNCLSIALACFILSELSVYLMLNFLL